MNKQETSPYKPVKWNLFLIAISFAPAVFKMHGKKPFPPGFRHDNYILLFFHIMTVLQYTLYGMIRNIMTHDTIEFEQYIETFFKFKPLRNSPTSKVAVVQLLLPYNKEFNFL